MSVDSTNQVDITFFFKSLFDYIIIYVFLLLAIHSNCPNGMAISKVTKVKTQVHSFSSSGVLRRQDRPETGQHSRPENSHKGSTENKGR